MFFIPKPQGDDLLERVKRGIREFRMKRALDYDGRGADLPFAMDIPEVDALAELDDLAEFIVHMIEAPR